MTLRVRWSELDEETRKRVLRRPATSSGAATRDAVLAIIAEVRSGGDAALRRLTERFDGARLEALAASPTELQEALHNLSRERRAALERAIDNLTRFHAAQREGPVEVETQPGVHCSRVTRPIARVGLYAPGGSAPLASTVLMLGVPARLAGCPTRILCTPPRRDGTVDAHVLAAAALTGLSQVFKIGGAHAIAAMAYGTESVPKVDKIFGPGNAWVTQAKLMVAEDPEGAVIDMPAGPSEALVIADGEADPALVAADLLSQAEHGPDSHVVLITTEARLADRALGELEQQVATLPRRSIAEASLTHALVVEAASTQEAVAIANRYAPEHLILQTADARQLVAQVTSAGSVFVGAYSPESAGDYASGTNHVLPTYGFARAQSGLSLDAFVKKITVQELTSDGLTALGPTIEVLAELEGLEAHRRAVTLRRARAESGMPAGGRSAPIAAPAGAASLAGLGAGKAQGTAAESASATRWPASLARAAVRELVPYRSARSAVATAPILLDANESPWPPLPRRPGLNRYPSPQPSELVSRLAALYGVEPERVIVGRGTDDVIDWLVRAFCEAREDGIVICPPTYDVYAVAAQVQGARVRPVPLGPAPAFAVDVDALVGTMTPADKLVFLCSPNNPTGGLVDPSVVSRLCDALGERALVVLDEAYVEFASAPSLANCGYPNLVVLRTLSKAYGLAGARCGVGIAHPAVVGLLQKVRAPYPLALPAVEAVLDVLGGDGPARARSRIEGLRVERQRLGSHLSRLPCVREVLASEANFLLVRFSDAGRAVAACRGAGIVIRDRSSELNLPGCARITVGAPEENERLLAVLATLRD